MTIKEQLIVAILLIIISALIAYLIGKNRRIGPFWSFFFCVFLSPLLGFIFTLVSPKKRNSNSSTYQKWRYGLGIAALVFGFYLMWRYIGIGKSSDFHIATVGFGFGIAGLGYYLFQTGSKARRI